MQQLPHDEDVAAADLPCRVVTAAEVAQLRAVSPDTAIVALVRSIDPDEVIASHLAGADIVLPCDGPPDDSALQSARAAARLVRWRTVTGRRTHDKALHELRTGVQSTVMLADLLESDPGAVERSVRLLRALAAATGDAVESLGRSTPAARTPESPFLAQTEILEGIARRVPLGRSLHGVVEAMEAQLPGSICSILLLDAESGTLTHGAAPHLPPQYRGFIDGVRIGPSTGSCGTAAYRRHPVVAVDIADDPRWTDFKDVALQHGLRACWSTPILDADAREVLGTFAVYHGRPWEPAAADVQLVERFTHTAAIAIGTHTLFSRLTESESRFRSAFEGAEVGMALIAPDGRMSEVNPALGRMLGRTRPGSRLSEHLHPDDVEEVTRALQTCAVDGTPIRLPEVRLLADGWDAPVWTTLSGSLVTGPDGAARHLVVELFDLTERRRVAQARREQAMAEAANQAKTDLLALVSHELRTPLNAVIGFAQVMQLVELDPDRRDGAVEHILTAGRHLLQVINDLLDLTGAETGRLVPDRRPFDPDDIVSETVHLLEDLAVRGGLDLIWRRSDDPVVLVGDPRRYRQVLINLVGNALKFTPPGGVVRIHRDGPGVLISDTGPGIPEADRHLLFTPFHRIGTDRSEGSGLGLALSDRLTRAMGGTLALLERPGPGTTFQVRLPAADGVTAPATHGPTTTAPSPEPEGRVLYVEDDRAAVELVAAALACWPGIDLVCVPDLAGARRQLDDHRRPVDLVLVDLDLPDGSGWDLVGRGTVPAVVVSAGIGTAPDGVRAAAQLTKPVMVQDLRSTVARVMAAPPSPR